MVLRSVGVLSCGKVMGAVYGLLGLIIGGIFTLFAVLGGAVAGQPEARAGGMLFGVAAIILAPIFYGIAGFVFGLITAALYNVAAPIVGGLELDLENRTDYM